MNTYNVCLLYGFDCIWIRSSDVFTTNEAQNFEIEITSFDIFISPTSKTLNEKGKKQTIRNFSVYAAIIINHWIYKRKSKKTK